MTDDERNLLIIVSTMTYTSNIAQIDALKKEKLRMEGVSRKNIEAEFEEAMLCLKR